jgi:hypothetical protein
MVCRSGTVKLMDFGTARPIDATFKTMDGLISGTLQFLSPEQLEKGTLDFRTDLYSLGVTLYEMITGVNPFPQTSFIDLVSHKSKNKFQPLESFPVELPRRLKHIIYQCMHYDPLKRADSAAVLLKELTNIHQSLTSESPEAIMARLISDAGGKKVIVSSRRRHPLRLVAATVSLGFFAFCFYRFGMPDEPKLFLRSSAFAAYSSIHGGLLRLIPKPSGAAPSTGQSAGIPVGKSPDSAAQAQPPLTAASLPGGNTPKSLRGGNLKSKRIKTLMESLKVEYGTEDNLVIMEKAWQAKNYSTVLTIYDFLTPEQARSEQALIFKMRAYDSIGDTEQSAEFLENTNCNDGEFYLAKARLAFRNNNIPGCKLMLAISLSSPHALIDYDVLKREVYFMTALCATAQFDAEPNEQSYKDALDAWWQLKSVLRSDPDHPYNKKAASELQRLAKEMQKG